MTDFEIASLTLQEIAAWAAVVAAVAAAIVGPAQCLLIWKGLRLMEGSNRERAVALEQQREADERRHAEAMAALEAQSRALKTQSRALEALIERTAPAAAR